MFKLPKYNFFNFTPRYYDERRETREHRNRQILIEEGHVPTGEYKPNMRGKIRSFYGERPKAQKKMNKRLLIIIALLMLASYFAFYY